jgi:hypothetical protein
MKAAIKASGLEAILHLFGLHQPNQLENVNDALIAILGSKNVKV